MGLLEAFFEPLAAGNQRPLWLVFLCYSTWSGIQRAPLAGVLLHFSVHQVLIGASWVGSYSAVRRLMGQPLYCSAANAGLWGKRGCGDGSTHYTWLSTISLLPWLPGLSHRHFPQAFPTTISSHTSPQSISLLSTAALSQRLLHKCYTPAPTCCVFKGTSIPVWGVYGCSKDCLIFIPFRLSKISCFIFSLKCFSSDPDNCTNVAIGPLLQIPHPASSGPVLLTLLFPPLVPLSYRVLPGSIYSFSGGQVLLSTLRLQVPFLLLLCLKVYSWCIHGERCTPRPPAPPPSCPLFLFLITIFFKGEFYYNGWNSLYH